MIGPSTPTLPPGISKITVKPIYRNNGAMDYVRGEYVGTYMELDSLLVLHMFRMGGPQ